MVNKKWKRLPPPHRRALPWRMVPLEPRRGDDLMEGYVVFFPGRYRLHPPLQLISHEEPNTPSTSLPREIPSRQSPETENL